MPGQLAYGYEYDDGSFCLDNHHNPPPFPPTPYHHHHHHPHPHHHPHHHLHHQSHHHVPFTVKDIWLDDENDLIRSCGALSKVTSPHL